MMTPTVSQTAKLRGRLQLRRALGKSCPPGWLGLDCTGSGPGELGARGRREHWSMRAKCVGGTKAGHGQQLKLWPRGNMSSSGVCHIGESRVAF